jgi:hypothetical protein
MVGGPVVTTDGGGGIGRRGRSGGGAGVGTPGAERLDPGAEVMVAGSCGSGEVCRGPGTGARG